MVSGFSHNANQFGGTYQSSYTWFVTAIITPGGQNRVPRRDLQYNVHAKREFTRHEICWGIDSEDPSVHEWTASIRGGDTIQVIPKAQWPGWVNSVQEVEIELHATTHAASPLEIPSGVPVSQPGQKCYRPLDRELDEIRLIILDEGASDGPLACSLVHATASPHGPTIAYEALSYCWGDPRDRREITVRAPEQENREHNFSVTSALHTALQRLRLGDAKRVLWIDAICINQDDLEERSSQVARMKDIYANASSVVVWLGESDHTGNRHERSELAMKTVKAIQERVEDRSGTGASITPIEASLQDDTHHPLEDHGGAYYFILDWRLFESPWFRRTWVVQEVFNARSAVAYYGADALPWNSILRVNRCIGLRGMMPNMTHTTILPSIFESCHNSQKNTLGPAEIAPSSIACHTMLSDSPDRDILDVLVMGLDLDATDPRDKLFAMLQFGRETSQPTKLPREIAVDYTRPANEVFARFTKWWIATHKSLKILSAVQALEGRTWQATTYDTENEGITPEPELVLPSWSWGCRGRSNWAVGILGLSSPPLYSASRDSTPDIAALSPSTSDWKELPLKGIRIATISAINQYPYLRGAATHEALHRAYVALFDPLNLTGKWSERLWPARVETYVTDDDQTLTRNHVGAHRDSAMSTASFECVSPCFLATGNGARGLCPAAARVGDVIVVLYGGTVPFVLRGERRGLMELDVKGEVCRWRYVGECYLEGYMHGEAIDSSGKDGVRTAEEFVLV